VSEVSRFSPDPLYKQVKDILEHQILSGKLQPGDALPSGQQLCLQYGVSSITVRRALRELVAEGLINRRPGLGSFVTSNSKTFNLLLFIVGFYEEDWRKHGHLFSDLIGGIARVTWERQAVFSVAHVPPELGDVRSYIYSVIHEGVFDGMLLRVAADLEESCLVPFLETQFPYVVIKRYDPERIINCVVVDDVKGAFTATEHLINRGHSRIGLVVPQSIVVGRDRCKGYFEALEARGIDPDPDLVHYTDDFLEESGSRATSQLLALKDRPTAVFAPSDMLAVGAYRAIKDVGLEIPRDVAVVGYDDILAASMLSPPLTTVRTPYYDFGVRSASLLLDIISGRVKPPKRVQIDQSLVVRESSGFLSHEQLASKAAAAGM
jgi:DNA-binding LacI/PurR family transcriptional regulator